MNENTIVVVCDLSSMPYPAKFGDPVFDKWIKDHWRKIGVITNVASDSIEIELLPTEQEQSAKS